MKWTCVFAAIAVGVSMACRSVEPETNTPSPAADASALPTGDVDAALRSAAPDLDRRIARFKAVRMPFDGTGLTDRERRLIDQLVIACRYVERMFWRQNDPEGLALYKALEKNETPVARSLHRFLVINGSRWDLVDENRPFVGTTPEPPGHALYPPGVTRAEIEAYVAANPGRRSEIYSPFTFVRKDAVGNFAGRRYRDEFKPFVEGAAEALRQAASLSDDPAFANFLELRADALISEDYYPSDVAWVELKDPKIDLIFGSQETYLDSLLGVKTSFGAAILIRNETESRNLAKYQQWVPELQDALPLPAEDRPSRRGHVTPMEVMDAPFRAGDLRHGYQAVAVNLPNDPRIHQEKGTKKIFFKNFMDARVKEVILPLATRLMEPAQAARASAEGYLAWVVMHEISHGLGPAFVRGKGAQLDIREAIGGMYSGLEEAKADVGGLFALKWLVDRGVFPEERLDEYYASYLAGIFRTVRFGTGEAHGRAVMMEFNYLTEQGAIVRQGAKYRADYARMAPAIARLAKELLEQEATGDRARAEAWFARYDRMPADLKSALDAAGDVPIDVDPMFSFPDLIE